MVVGVVKIEIHIPWSHSLKEKRQVIRSIVEKVRSKYHVSAMEVEINDLHQLATIGIAFVAVDASNAAHKIDQIISFVETNTDAMIHDFVSEYLYV